jgi:hypothetical protein
MQWNLLSQLLKVVTAAASSGLVQQVQMSAGAALAFSVKFQQVFARFWNTAVALLHAGIEEYSVRF